MMLLRKKFFCIIAFLGQFFLGYTQLVQEFTNISPLGIPGLIYTPSAYTADWGEVQLGYTHFSQRASLSYEAGTAPERSFLASIVFLPAVELSLKVTRPYSNLVKNFVSGPRYYGIGDRSISLRVQLLKEKKNRPAILVGIQDLGTASAFFKTNYIVLSKKMMLKQVALSTTLGYGRPIGEARAIFLNGPFGGIQAEWKGLSGLIEYDTERINLGLTYKMKNRLAIQLGLINGQYFIISISSRFRLKQR